MPIVANGGGLSQACTATNPRLSRSRAVARRTTARRVSRSSGVDMDPVSKAFVDLKALEEIFEQKYPVVYDSGRDFLKEIEAMDLDQMDIDRLSTYQVRLRRPQTTAPNASGNDYEDYPFSPFSDDMDQVDVAGMLAQRVVFTTCL